MTYDFEHIRDNLMTEIKADLLHASIMLAYQQENVINPKTMSKGEANEGVMAWTSKVISLEKRLEMYKKFDLKKLKKYDL